jgi:hypothetical protein
MSAGAGGHSFCALKLSAARNAMPIATQKITFSQLRV